MTATRTKFIFITGGVVSSLGKGIVAASVGALLETRGLRVKLTKVDPYLNVDPGTMNPLQHGEVFVTDDGAETDLDLGHYERFTQAQLSRENSFSTGQIYDAVLSKERRGDYLGGTVQVIPHVTDEIKQFMFRASQNTDIAIIEIGGTVGDIEGQPFLEAIRQIRFELGEHNTVHIHLTLVPYIKAARELKTKPTQHSVKELRAIGIQPNILCLRADRIIPDELREKIARTCNVKKQSVFDVHDSDSIYLVPLMLHEQNLDQVIVDYLNIWTAAPQLDQWEKIAQVLKHPESSCRIGIIGKYVDVYDAYKSVNEALVHAGIAHNAAVEVIHVDSAKLNKDNAAQLLSSLDGIIVPGGFGNRGIEGKITAIEYARQHNIPFLGICLGMQLAAIEFARHVINLSDATSQEFDASSKNQIIHLMEHQKGVHQKGGTMRLGAYPCKLKKNSQAYAAYGTENISERHRHRFEFNNDYRDLFEQKGAIFSGTSPDDKLVEIFEISNHPYFVACQFHPELKSKPIAAHPLFKKLVQTALELKST